MKFKVTVDSQIETYETVDEAVSMIIKIASRLSVGAILAAREKNEKLRKKNIKTRDSIKLEIVNG